MRHQLKAAMLAQEMLKRRDIMRTALGAEYAENMRTPRELLLAVSEREGCAVLEVARKLCLQAMDDRQEMAVNLIIAAAVDLTEESTESKGGK